MLSFVKLNVVMLSVIMRVSWRHRRSSNNK